MRRPQRSAITQGVSGLPACLRVFNCCGFRSEGFQGRASKAELQWPGFATVRLSGIHSRCTSRAPPRFHRRREGRRGAALSGQWACRADCGEGRFDLRGARRVPDHSLRKAARLRDARRKSNRGQLCLCLGGGRKGRGQACCVGSASAHARAKSARLPRPRCLRLQRIVPRSSVAVIFFLFALNAALLISLSH